MRYTLPMIRLYSMCGHSFLGERNMHKWISMSSTMLPIATTMESLMLINIIMLQECLNEYFLINYVKLNIIHIPTTSFLGHDT